MQITKMAVPTKFWFNSRFNSDVQLNPKTIHSKQMIYNKKKH